MKMKNNINISTDSVIVNLTRLTNQIYKLLPLREEGADWELPLSTIYIEFAGMDEVLYNQHDTLFPLLCKLKGLYSLNTKEDFFNYRRTIFECLGLVGDIIANVREHQ